MAITTLCARLLSGHDAACETLTRRYFQQAVIINKADIDPSFTITTPTEATCAYNVVFTLKEGATGYLFTGPESGSVFFGSVGKSRSDYGFPQYSHNVQMLLTGASEDAKCILDSLDKGSFVVALQLMDGTVEIYGFGNGLTTSDYDYNLQEGGGGAPVTLSSLENTPESRLPYVYKSAVAGNESAEFESLFSNPEPVAP